MSVLYSFVGSLFCAVGVVTTVMAPGELAGSVYVVGGVIISCLAHIISLLNRNTP